HPRQPGRGRPALERHRLSLREAPVAERPERVGRARRAAPRGFDRDDIDALTTQRSFATPVTSPPLPVPRPGSRAADPPPRTGRNFSGTPQNAERAASTGLS